jgi:hypothetical protein
MDQFAACFHLLVSARKDQATMGSESHLVDKQEAS